MRIRPWSVSVLPFAALLLVLSASSAPPAAAAGDARLAGFWSGNIEVPGRPIEVRVMLEQDENAWSARIDVPAQGIRKAEMTGVEIDGTAATMKIPGVPGDPTFAGKLDESGDVLAGDYSQAGRTIPFRLERSEVPADYDDDPYAEYEQPGTVGEGFGGSWRGVLTAGPHRFRMLLEVEAGGEEPSARLTSVDQGGTPIPVESLALEGRTIRFEIPAIRGAFEGTLNGDGSELDGSWTQGGGSIPLTLKRFDG